MKPIAALVLLQLCLSSAGLAQQSRANYDSLKEALSMAKNDSTRISTLVKLSQDYMFNRPDSALYYGYQGLALCRKTNDVVTEVLLLRDIGTAHYSLGNKPKALQQTQRALRVADENKLLSEKATLLMILSARHSVGFPEQISLLREAEALLDSMGSSFAPVATTYIADLFLRTHQLDSAIVYGQIALKKSIPRNLWWVRYRVELTLGHIEQARGNYDLAIEHFRSALPLGGTTLGDFDTNFAIAQFFQETNNMDSCIFYAQRSLEMAQDGELYLRVVDASTMLSSIYEKIDLKKAYEYSLVTIAAKDSVDKLNEKISVESLTNFDVQERQYELDLARTKYQNQLWLYIFLGSTFTLLTIGLFSYRITEQKQKAKLEMEHLELEKVREIDKIKSTLYTNLSHEFRTPLTLIIGQVSIFMENAKNQATIEGLKKIERNADALLKLINQLLALAKLESGDLSIEKEDVNLNTFLSTLTSSFSPLAMQKNIALKVALTNSNCIASLDKGKLEMIANNLVSNAIKFTPSGGKIDIRAEVIPAEELPSPNHTTLVFSVTDSGMGIPTTEHEKIFDRFYQLSSSQTEVGTGIGLALVKELTKLLDGSITVQSKPGHGSTFKLAVPVSVSRVLDGEEKSRLVEVNVIDPGSDESILSNSDNNLDRQTLLVVEDNVDLSEFIIEALGTDYEFFEAMDGKAGLRLAIDKVPDLIISDIMMPEMDGLTMLKSLKNDMRTSHIPVILLTAKATMDDKLMGLETGADDYLTKPFDRQELILKVRNVMTSRIKIRDKLRIELLREAPKLVAVSSDEKLMLRVKEAIQERLNDSQLSVESLAREIGLSRAQFYRKVTALTGTSVNDLIRSFRLEKAAQLIAQKWGPVTQVAYEVGFSSPSYFTKCFKDYFGVLPSEYQSRLTGQGA